MSNPVGGPTESSTSRPAVTTLQTTTEGVAVFTPLAVIVGYVIDLHFPDMPVPVQHACIALFVALGGSVMTALRHWSHRRKGPGAGPVALLLLVALSMGCVSWDGARYGALATAQIWDLQAIPSIEPIAESECAALERGAVALRDSGGNSRSVQAPLFSGRHLEQAAATHDRLAAVCFELAFRELTTPIDPNLRARNRRAWWRVWVNGRALFSSDARR